jgi:replication factor A1
MQHDRFTFWASVIDYDLCKGWWYEACPECTKSLITTKNTNIYPDDHSFIQPPLPCNVTDEEDFVDFMLVGKIIVNFFGSSTHSYVYDKKFNDAT